MQYFEEERMLRRGAKKPTAYERFIAEQGIPIFRGLGLRDLSELRLAPWERSGGRGAFIELQGMEGVTGMYAVEIPPAGALKPEKHIYEEMIFVVHGRGTTEVWKDGGSQKQTFEWQAGSLFSPPLNCWHRLVNATSSPALALVVTNAPPVMDMFDNPGFIFDCPFDFSDRYNGSAHYFEAKEMQQDAERGNMAVLKTNFVPDLFNYQLSVENARGGLALESAVVHLFLASNCLGGHVGEYAAGRYTRIHYHGAGAVLICLSGKGYTLAWPRELGTRPWESGVGDQVLRQEYVRGGVVSPGTGWFHAHFSPSNEPLRLLALRFGGKPVGFHQHHQGRSVYLDVKKGGTAINHRDEDPQVRRDFEEALRKEGATFRMPDEVYA